MNFKIIENHEKNIEYDNFKKDFMNPEITVKKIIKKYDLSPKQYNVLRNKVCEETGLKKKPYATMKNKSTNRITENTYIRKNKITGKYYILKKINGKRKSFGTYSNIETAREKRNELIRNNWNI